LLFKNKSDKAKNKPIPIPIPISVKNEEIVMADDEFNKLIGYLSVRRKSPVSAINVIELIYQNMLKIEQSISSSKIAEQKSIEYLPNQLDR